MQQLSHFLLLFFERKLFFYGVNKEFLSKDPEILLQFAFLEIIRDVPKLNSAEYPDVVCKHNTISIF